MILLQPFIPLEYRYLWENLYNKYYSDVKDSSVPEGPETLPVPEHYNNLLPINLKFNNFALDLKI